MSDAKITTDHDIIREWAESRDGYPATVSGTSDNEEAGVLRIAFSEDEANMTRLSWDEFFEKFDAAGLQFLYQEKTGDGAESRFSKFVRGE